MTIVSDFLAGKEWYDNSFLETTDRCVRKAFWRNVFTIPPGSLPTDTAETAVVAGIEDSVGFAAKVGSAHHAAFDKFYSPTYYHTQTYQQRRLIAIRSFIKKYQQLIPDHDDLEIPTVYGLARNIDLLDMYFDHYESEDQLYEPVETEIALVVQISYRPTDPYFFPPFFYVCRLDSVWRRIATDDYWVTEHKTSTRPDMKMKELMIGRQGKGYVWGQKQFKSLRPIEGLLGNILAMRASEHDPSKLFFRDYIHLSDAQLEEFRLQTINKVTRWRSVQQLAAKYELGPMHIAMYDQSTCECTRYGTCTYYDLCMYGPGGTDLTKFQRQSWNPLFAEKMEPE